MIKGIILTFILSVTHLFTFGQKENFKIIWQNDAPAEAHEKMNMWLDSLVGYSYEVIGEFPDTLRFYLTHENISYDCVGWAMARYPKKNRGVYMTVDSRYSIDEFLSGWKAPHEICHLSLPFMGTDNRWISEGYATFMSRQILLKMGAYDEATLKEFYQEGYEEIAHFYQTEESFEATAKELVASHQYNAFYRGGSTLFYVLDYFVWERHQKRFSEIVKEYQKNVIRRDQSFDELQGEIDDIIGEPIFRTVVYYYKIFPAKSIMDFVLKH